MRSEPIPEPGDIEQVPFSNSTMFEHWASGCVGCIHDDVYGIGQDATGNNDCPLITLAYLGTMPHEWLNDNGSPGACTAYDSGDTP